MTKRMSNRLRNLPPNDILLAAARDLFEYHADGRLTFRRDPRHRLCTASKIIGRTVGGDDGHGYRMCLLLGHRFKVHQVVWLLHTGEFPTSPIDHVNRDRRDNRIENLRLVSDVENQQNLVASTVASAGTWRSPRSGRFCARLTYRGKKIYLGYFDTVEEANLAYRNAKRKIAGEFAPF